MDVNYEGEYEEISGYAEAFCYNLARKHHYAYDKEDILQQFYSLYFDPDVIEKAIEGNSINTKLAFYIAKKRVLDYLRSKQVNYSYGNRVEHLSIDAMDDDDLNSCGVDLVEIEQEANEDCEIERLLKRLSSQQRYSIEGSTLAGYTHKELGKVVELSRSSVSKIVKSGMDVMKSCI